MSLLYLGISTVSPKSYKFFYSDVLPCAICYFIFSVVWELAALAICSCAISCWNLGANGGLYYGLKFAVMPSDGHWGKKEGPDQPLCYCPNISANQLIRTPKQLNLDRSKCVLAKEHAAEKASQWTVQSVNINWILQLKNNKKNFWNYLAEFKVHFPISPKTIEHVSRIAFTRRAFQWRHWPVCRTSQPDIGFTRSKALCRPPLIVPLALACQWRCYRTASWALLGKRPPSLTVGKLCCSAENSAYFLLLIRLLGKRLTCHGLWSPPSFPSRSWQLYFHHKSVLPTIWNIVWYRSKYWWNSQPLSLCAHPRFGLEGAFISAAKPPRLHKWIICFRISAPHLHT